MSSSPLFAQTERQELAVPIGTTLLGSLGLTALLYGLVYPLRATPLGSLLFERGLTQILVVFLGIFILFYLSYRLAKIRGEFKHLNQDIIPANIFRISPTHPGLTNLQQALLQEKTLLTRRCSRVLGAYQQCQGRRAAAEFAQEDSIFYQQMMASAYALPRALLWSIPLLGFIGTLVGIGAAVQGFAQFLEQAGNLEQVQNSFGAVAGGLTVAFDTTLAALCLSILGMVFLSLVERQENQLLLLIDIYIADKILPRLQEPDLELPQTDWRDSLEEVVQELLPRKTAAVVPRGMAPESSESLVAEVQTVQKHLIALLEGIYQSHQDWQRQSQAADQRLETALAEFREQIATALTQRPALEPVCPPPPLDPALVQSLGQLARTLGRDFPAALGQLETRQEERHRQTQDGQRHLLEGLAQLLGVLERLAQVPPEPEQLTAVLGDIQQTLAALRPSLERLNAPRRLVVFEQEDPSHETGSP